jgi:hypothetical protein
MVGATGDQLDQVVPEDERLPPGETGDVYRPEFGRLVDVPE